MVGAAFEVSAAMTEWLFSEAGRSVAEPMRELVDCSKRLSFRLARRRAFDSAPTIEEMAASWERAMGGLDALLD